MAPRTTDREATDRELVSRTRAGDMRSFETIVERYHGRIMGTAMRILGDEEEARDASQETFARAYRGLSFFDPERSFSTWLYRITVNACYDQARRRGRRPRTTSLDELPARKVPAVPASEGSGSELFEVVRALADTLTVEQRTAFVLRDVEGRPTSEVALVMACPEATVRSHLHRARSRLRVMLARRYPELVEGVDHEL